MEAAGYILLKDSWGLSKSTLKKLIPAVPYSEVIILRGELITVKQNSSSETKYQLHRDPNVYVKCINEDIAPLNKQDFLLMEGIEKPADRMEAFINEKLDWGITLKEGSTVYVILNTQYARAVVHYKGVIGNVPGIRFGMEFLEGHYRTGNYGTTEGSFQGHRYFKCQDNCGLFVSLAQLSKEPFPTANRSSTREASEPRGTKSYVAAAETEPYSKSAMREGNVETHVPLSPSEFHIGQRVKFYDRNGISYQGEICWTGRGTPCGLPKFNVVGIKTEKIVFRYEFEHCIRGMDRLAPSVQENYVLFFPEYLVDDATNAITPRKDESGVDMMTPGLDYVAETGGCGGLYNHNLEVGSLVQMKLNDTNPRYSTIKRIGNIDNIQGTIAGIELDEEMDGCTDGTFEPNGRKFFNCPERKGIYYPFESLKPDERYAPEEKAESPSDKKNPTSAMDPHPDSQRWKSPPINTENRQQLGNIQHANPVSQQPFPANPNPSASVSPENLESRKNEEKGEPPADISTPKKVLQCGAVEIYIDDILGIGAHGKVCRAKNGQLLCAAKLLRDTMFQYNDPGIHTWAKKFEDECKFLSTIKHPNIVQYLDTIRIPESGRSALLMELMDESLTHFLKQSSGPLPYRTQVNICHDVALALAYLHLKNVIHRDLSSNNVLLAGAEHRAKVTDFGMFKLMNMKAHMTATKLTQTQGTPPYMPPEALIIPPRYSNKLDCFSHGVLTIQIITRNFPDPGDPYRYIDDPNYPNRIIFVSFPEKDRRKKDIDLIEPDHPLLLIAIKCIKDEEEERPSADELCKQLGSLKKGKIYKDDAKSPGSPKAEAIGIASAGSQMEVGSFIRIPLYDITNPWRYGTIKWIGNLENIQGKIAGIELDDPMDDCTDGTFAGTGQKFFNCPQGRGMYYFLENLMPSEIDATLEENPLRDVVDVTEEYVSNLIIDKYIGNRKGIQGYQNSSCLDATLFGLFSLSIEFDDIFLQGSRNPNDAIRQILWRNIINPLRKHGVVRFESVLKLQEELLERMKRIPKDPREFLRLIFEYPPPTPHFISIRRPRGIEQNYFVELFLEADESMKVPSIGGLLAKMFFEQQISFTEVPSKLLIQVPKRDASMLIPFKVLNVAKIVDLDIPYLCQFCGSKAGKSCTLCINDFFSTDRTVHFCEDCCGKIHSHPNRKGHPYRWCDEMEHLFQVANLELLSVICVENNHYVCFTRHDNRWIFFDSMANRVGGKYYIPKVEECTADLNEWVYPRDGDFSRLLKTSPHELPELVRRFTQDIYMCVYVQPDLGMY